MKNNVLKRALAMICVFCLMAGMTMAVSAENEQRRINISYYTAGSDSSSSMSGYLYSNADGDTVTPIEGISYNADTNTLTLSGYKNSALNLSLYGVGTGFKLILTGDNELSSLFFTQSSIEIGGTGSLVLNKDKAQLAALTVQGDEKDSTIGSIKIGADVTLTLYKGSVPEEGIPMHGDRQPAALMISYTASATSPLTIEGSLAEELAGGCKPLTENIRYKCTTTDEDNCGWADRSAVKSTDSANTKKYISEEAPGPDNSTYQNVYEVVPATATTPSIQEGEVLYFLDMTKDPVASLDITDAPWHNRPLPEGYEYVLVETGVYHYIYTNDVIKIAPKSDAPAADDNTGDNTGDDNGNTGDNTGSTGDNTGSTGDNTGSTGDNTGSTGDNTGNNAGSSSGNNTGSSAGSNTDSSSGNNTDSSSGSNSAGSSVTVDAVASAEANTTMASTVTSTAEGGTVTVSVPAKVEIKQETLQALKDKNQKLELTSTTASGESVTWTIDTVTEAKAFNPTVTLEAKIKAVEDTLEAATLPATTKLTEVSFDHDGTLPGTAKVKLPLSNTKFTEGATVHLYYFDPVAKLFEKIDSATYTSGAATFTMTHCSDYVVTSEELPSDLIKKAPGTGAYLNGSVYVMLVLLGAVAVVIGIKRKDLI